MSFSRYRKLIPIKHYIDLVRLNRPTGVYLLMWPAWWSIALATKDYINFKMFVIFALGALAMRSAGCVINDIVDRKVDAMVLRTKNRPLASGKVSLFEAVLIALLLLIAALFILFTLNEKTIMLGVSVVPFVVIYPFVKRFSYWPQIFLGLIFNWGAIMGWVAMRNEIDIVPLIVYAAGFFWTLGYDTIYAHQDKLYDNLAGVKSMALRFDSKSKKYIYIFYGVTLACFWLLGVMLDLGIIYNICFIIGMTQLFWQVASANLDDPKDCFKKFASNHYFGIVMFAGIMSTHFY